MAAKTISQKKFAKLVASTGVLSQPPGALTRISNLLFTQRGSLQIADGSEAIAHLLAPYTYPLALGIFSANKAGQFPIYLALARNPARTIADFTAGTYSGVLSGGSSGLTKIFRFYLAAYDAGGILHNTPVTLSLIGKIDSTTLTVTFVLPAGATTVAVYWSPSSDPNSVYGIGSSAASPIVAPLSTASPTVLVYVNTSLASQLEIGLTGPTGIAFSLAAGTPYSGPVIAQAQIAPGSLNFNYASPYPGYSPYGGTAGIVCPIPQIVQFAGKSILILGNGVAPQQVDPSVASPVPINLVNTFTAAYTTWQASLSWTSGSQLTAANGATNYLFTATQAGVSGTVTPSWNFTKGDQTTDGTVIWTSQGPLVPTVAPIGAAHAVAYAGSLWLANTWPTNTAFDAWLASTLYSVGQQIVVYDTATPANAWLFTVQVAGTSGGTTPSWTFTSGTTTTDGGVTWLNSGEPAPALVAGIDGPACLKMSDANNYNSWNPVNVAFVGRADGTQITGLQPFTIAALGISPTGSLCVFKEFTTYQVIGVFGSTSFEIQPAQTNLGCIAARSIQFLPGFGVVRFSHLGFAVFDGINDRLISEDIRSYLFGGVDSEADLVPVDPTYLYLSQSAQTISPPMYLCAMPLVGAVGAMTRLFCYDLVMKSWTVLDLPWAITTLTTVAAGEGYPLILAGRTDGSIQRVQAGDLNWDQSGTGQSAVQWGFRSPDVFGEGSTQKLFYEQATIRGYGNATMVKSILASIWLDGKQIGAQAIDVVPQGGSNLFEARVRIFRSGYRAHIDFSGNNGGAAGVIDAVDWAVSPKSPLARRVIS